MVFQLCRESRVSKGPESGQILVRCPSRGKERAVVLSLVPRARKIFHGASRPPRYSIKAKGEQPLNEKSVKKVQEGTRRNKKRPRRAGDFFFFFLSRKSVNLSVCHNENPNLCVCAGRYGFSPQLFWFDGYLTGLVLNAFVFFFFFFFIIGVEPQGR